METPEARSARLRAAANKRWAALTPEQRREATLPSRLVCYETNVRRARERRVQRMVDDVVANAGKLTAEQLDVLRGLLPAPVPESAAVVS